jgi:hypothetical protein
MAAGTGARIGLGVNGMMIIIMLMSGPVRKAEFAGLWHPAYTGFQSMVGFQPDPKHDCIVPCPNIIGEYGSVAHRED